MADRDSIGAVVAEMRYRARGQVDYTRIENWADRLAALSPAAPERESCDPVCVEPDGCPTELAVLQRFWRANQNDAAPAGGEPVGGKALSKERDQWFASLSGATLEGSPSGKYLRNRLELAFIGGWDAREKYPTPPAVDVERLRGLVAEWRAYTAPEHGDVWYQGKEEGLANCADELESALISAAGGTEPGAGG